MRKQLILAAVAALGALICSCEREKDITIEEPVKSDEVSLVLGGIATRSAEEAPIMRTNYDLGEVMDGFKFSLEEVVTEMGDLVDDTPETRGTPAYTQNVTDVHGNKFNGEIWSASGRVAVDGPFDVIDLSGGRKAWRRALGFDAWKKANGPVSFYLHMPSSPHQRGNYRCQRLLYLQSPAFLLSCSLCTEYHSEDKLWLVDGGCGLYEKHY